MRLTILSDVHWESRVDIVVRKLADFKLREYFESRDYGSGLLGITVVFMCRHPSYPFKRRIRFTKNDKNLSMDIMLDFAQMVDADPACRQHEVAQRLFDEVPEVLDRYKLKNFAKEVFVAEFRERISNTGWILK